MSPLQLVSQVVETPQVLERKKRTGTARQVKQEKNSPFLAFFKLLAWTGWGKSVDTTGKNALKLVKLPKLKVTRLKRAKI